MAATILLISCTQNQASQNTGDTMSDDSVAVKPKLPGTVTDTLMDDLASVISGIPPVNLCRELTKEKSWIRYQEQISSDWKLVEKNKTGPIARWRAKNIDSVTSATPTLFYPFAGADFLYANAFFPDAGNYILVGLEPVGKLHRCDTMQKNDFLTYLEKIRSALYYSNHLGFFRTKSMEKDLNQQSLDGTLPLIVFYIRKSGHHLTGITYFNLDRNGGIVPCRQDTSTIGVRVSFVDTTRKKQQVLYYLSYDLSDQNLRKHPEFLLFAGSFSSQVCFLKAASYLMFLSDFHLMRNYLLDHSSAILQDDSGIPYRYFKHATWSVKLFGDYTQTIDLFKFKFQPDLEAAYKKQETKHAVPFRIGYNVKFNETNLLFAKKKN
ncbi:MAG: hypothetical protein NTW10_15345 [Bacteroidetes bacterium]|nr:hypothetical protein [Bacteroidota bacterium]